MLSTPIRVISRRLQEHLITPTELCVACVTRADYIKKLHAFIRLTRAVGNQQANESWSRHKLGKAKGVLDGIPIAVKDNFCTRNIPTTCGSKMLENFVPTYHATAVQKLQDAGTVLIGKCNMDEFAMGSGTVDSIYGPTKNIWGSGVNYRVSNSQRTYYQQGDRADPIRREQAGENTYYNDSYLEDEDEDADWHIAGGSSGGSAVAVATGAVFAALGSDTGGSTRNPAAYCGVVGLKPTYGLVSRHGLIPLVNSMDAPSVLARSVDDAALVLDCIAGPDKLDSTTVHRAYRPIGETDVDVDMTRLTVGVPREYYCPGMSAEVVQVWAAIADLLESAGARVKQVSMPHTQDSIVCYSILNQAEVASNMARYDGIEFGLRAEEARSTEQLYAASRSAGFNEVVRGRIFAGNYFLLQRNYEKYFVKALKVRRLIADDFASVWLSGVDVLLTPATLTDAPLYSEFSRADNRTQCATQDFCTQPANMAGCPAISIPITLSERGLPLSLQLMSKNFNEKTLISVAKWIEKIVDFPRLEIES